MDMLAAGPVQLDDWFQIIVILFVVVGSIFGALSKKLIERFTPKDAQRDDNERSQATRGTESPAQPAAPVARPLQPMSRLGPATQHPAARPSSPPPVTEHAIPAGPSPPLVPSPPRRARPRAPAAKRLPHPGHVVSEPAKAEQRLGHLTPVVELTGDREEVAAEQRLGHLETTIEDRDDRIEAVIEEHLGHGDTTRPTPYAQRSARRRVPVFGRATPQVLRQAVLMREILGPPIALRRDDERF